MPWSGRVGPNGLVRRACCERVGSDALERTSRPEWVGPEGLLRACRLGCLGPNESTRMVGPCTVWIRSFWFETAVPGLLFPAPRLTFFCAPARALLAPGPLSSCTPDCCLPCFVSLSPMPRPLLLAPMSLPPVALGPLLSVHGLLFPALRPASLSPRPASPSVSAPLSAPLSALRPAAFRALFRCLLCPARTSLHPARTSLHPARTSLHPGRCLPVLRAAASCPYPSALRSRSLCSSVPLSLLFGPASPSPSAPLFCTLARLPGCPPPGQKKTPEGLAFGGFRLLSVANYFARAFRLTSLAALSASFGFFEMALLSCASAAVRSPSLAAMTARR